MRAVLIFGLLFSAVGCEEPKYVFDCTCQIDCDGDTVELEATECREESQIQEAVDDAVAECVDELTADGTCQEVECGCQCEQTDELCDE